MALPPDNLRVAALEIENLSKSFRRPDGAAVRAVDHFNLAVAEGEYLTLVGPSGCGKTTLLRVIAGLEEPDAGVIRMAGRPMKGVPPRDRDVAMVFQSDALFPHLTARENLAFGLRVRGVSPAEIHPRVDETASLLDLADCLDRLPGELSGGQRQRVTVGRAVIRRPRWLLLDEPLCHLDEPLREQMRGELRRLQQHLGATFIHVTHDQAEALALGQRVVIMANGALQQLAAPGELYQRPANLFVAGFIGSPRMNLLRGTLLRRASGVCFVVATPSPASADLPLEIPVPGATATQFAGVIGREVTLGLRPESLAVRSLTEPPGSGGRWTAVVDAVECAGREARVRLVAGPATLLALVPAAQIPSAGQPVELVPDWSAARLFDAASGANLA